MTYKTFQDAKAEEQRLSGIQHNYICYHTLEKEWVLHQADAICQEEIRGGQCLHWFLDKGEIAKAEGRDR
jgi:hypothetical protein